MDTKVQCPHTNTYSSSTKTATRAPALAGQLERLGYRVTTASSGGGMLRALERARIDLVMLDVQFSDEDGMRLCRSLRAASDVPFIILARRADEVDRILGLEMGADDYLAKPVNFREMLARMRNILRRANASARARPRRARDCFASAAGSSTASRASS